MNVEMREDKHLCVTFNPQKGDARQVIIDEEHKDIRICDGKHIIKVRFFKEPKYPTDNIQDVLVDDIFVWRVKP